MKIIWTFAALAFAWTGLAAAPTVTSLTAQQRYPWNGLVDIVVGLSGSAGDVAGAECTFAATNSTTKQALAVSHITPNGADTGSGTTWTRRYVWDAAVDVGAVQIDDVALTVDVKVLGGVQLWEGGPYWAECNVGATKPEESGYYFWWGDTVGYMVEGWTLPLQSSAQTLVGDVMWVSSAGACMDRTPFDTCPILGRTRTELQSLGYIDATGNLVAAYDAATIHLGAPWRMPTDAEMSFLRNGCDWSMKTRNGVCGLLVKGRGAFSTKSIFLPAAGYGSRDCLWEPGVEGWYWTSVPAPDSLDSDYARALNFHGDYCGVDPSGYYRYEGLPIRPLRVAK